MTRLVLVRHGESDWNVERRIQGQSGTGLSSRGRLQAAHTARVIGESYPDAQLFSSDLQRCVETTVAVADALRVAPTLDAGLRERDFGTWTGQLVTDIARDEPEITERWRGGEDVIGEVGGEDTVVFTDRVRTTLLRILDTATSDDIVCVTHGGPVWHGTRALLELSNAVLGGIGNASITEIVVGADGRYRLGAFSQTSHLPIELRSWLGASTVPVRTAVAPPVGT